MITDITTDKFIPELTAFCGQSNIQLIESNWIITCLTLESNLAD